MVMHNRKLRRRGNILPFLVISLVTLVGFVALAVDIGIIAVAKTQAQNVADLTAMTGARTLDGSVTNNIAQAKTEAVKIATTNKILNTPVTFTGQEPTELRFGAYHYDAGTRTFAPQFPAVSPDTYNLVEATVSHKVNLAFAKIFGLTQFTISAKATAAHRPRDVAIVLDYSGSMNNESDLWNNEDYVGADFPGGLNLTSNSLDTAVPKFGHYSDTTAARLVCTSADSRVGKSNVTIPVLGIAAMVDDFYQHDRGASSTTKAFKSVNWPTTQYDTAVVGSDNYLKNGAAFVKTAREADPSGKLPSYTSFKGYTQAGGYWGMTFYIWPPNPALQDATITDADIATDPGKTHDKYWDWRLRFFKKTNGTPVDDNQLLWEGSGAWRMPGTYVINYKAILKWIKANCIQTTPLDNKPFPAKLRAGRILYYDQVPDDVPASAYTWTNGNFNITSSNPPTALQTSQRFWKEYIDFVLGVWRDPQNNGVQNPDDPNDHACSYGPDFQWGGTQISGPAPNNRYTDFDPTKHSTYIEPDDNPRRPRHRFWFGPMTMVQFLSDSGLLPGTAHDISMYPAKLGISAALQDISNNHPNDLVSLLMYHRPLFQGEQPASSGFNRPVTPTLSRDYAKMINALWFPPNSDTSDVRPWDPNGMAAPRAHADHCANTTTAYGFMLAYNQFSENGTVLAAGCGGAGRKGALKLIILETDGMANQGADPVGGFNSSGGSNKCYYSILPGQQLNAVDYSRADLLNVVQAICNKEDGTAVAPLMPPDSPTPSNFPTPPNYPGYSTSRQRVQIHTLAFGVVFEPNAAGDQADKAVDQFRHISAIGNTVFPLSSTDPENGYKWCIGTIDQRKNKLRQAITRAMGGGISVSLVENKP